MASKSLSQKPEEEKIPHLRMDLSVQLFSDEVMLNDVEQVKHLLTYDLGLAEKDCAWHSPWLAFAQLKALKNMRIRSQQSEDRRRECWGGLNEKYEERRDDMRVERREKHDSVPPLRRDTFKNVGEQRSRSASRVPSRDPAARIPQPPPAPVRAPVTPPKTPPTLPTKPRYKAAPASINPAPTSSTNVTPPVKAPPVAPPGPPPRSARSPSNDPLVPSRTVGTSANTPPWRLRERGRQRSQTPVERNTRTRSESRSDWSNRTRPAGVPEPPAPPSRMSGSQWLDQGHQGTSSSSTTYRDPGYSVIPINNHLTTEPIHTHNVEYVPGYTVPRQRWIQKYNGEWLDLIPQTPDQSTFFHQSGNQRRRNELDFYRYTFSMGL